MKYRLIRSNRKSIAISFDRDGNFKSKNKKKGEIRELTFRDESSTETDFPGICLVVRAPSWLGVAETESFVISRKEWIMATAKRLQREREKAAAGRLKLENGDVLCYLGEKRSLMVIREERSRGKVKCVMERLLLWVPYEADYEYRREQLEKWYRRQALLVFTQKAEEYAGLLGVHFEEIHIKDQKSRWGSCSGKGNLNFNWRLLMAPEPVCDYVIVHELCHLRFMDHSPSFWELVESICPDCRQYRGWLRENGGQLYPF